MTSDLVTLRRVTETRAWCDAQRRAGKRIGFVPTMGALHKGHLSLIRAVRERAQSVVVSIFVNPTQFGPNEDFTNYPRPLEADLDLCREEWVDAVFVPSVQDLYPTGCQTTLLPGALTEGLCGPFRPGHFTGVCTVVAKLLNAIGPCVAAFGQKDYQQLKIVERMVTDLCISAEILPCPIVRESDGLALSSRNAYLSTSERQSASAIHRALKEARLLAEENPDLSSASIVERARQVINREDLLSIQYLEVRNADTLETLAHAVPGNTLLAAAVLVGKTRLIDNLVF